MKKAASWNEAMAGRSQYILNYLYLSLLAVKLVVIHLMNVLTSSGLPDTPFQPI